MVVVFLILFNYLFSSVSHYNRGVLLAISVLLAIRSDLHVLYLLQNEDVVEQSAE